MYGRLAETLRFYYSEVVVISSCQVACLQPQLAPIEEQLNKARSKVRLCLELNEQSVSAAVSIYIQHKVGQLAQEKKYDDRTRDVVLEYLSSNANGIPLGSPGLSKYDHSTRGLARGISCNTSSLFWLGWSLRIDWSLVFLYFLSSLA